MDSPSISEKILLTASNLDMAVSKKGSCPSTQKAVQVFANILSFVRGTNQEIQHSAPSANNGYNSLASIFNVSVTLNIAKPKGDKQLSFNLQNTALWQSIRKDSQEVVGENPNFLLRTKEQIKP